MFYITSVSTFCESNARDDAKRNAGLVTPENVERFDNIPYGDNERNILDVYRPKDHRGKLPVIVSVHGGGWVYGNKEIMQFYCMSRKGICRYQLQLSPRAEIQASGAA